MVWVYDGTPAQQTYDTFQEFFPTAYGAYYAGGSPTEDGVDLTWTNSIGVVNLRTGELLGFDYLMDFTLDDILAMVDESNQ